MVNSKSYMGNKSSLILFLYLQFFIFIIRVDFSKQIRSSPLKETDDKTPEFTKSENLFNHNKNHIERMTTLVTINPKLNICDLVYEDQVSFVFSSPMNQIDHIIVSQKNPYYNFKATIVSEGPPSVKITGIKIYQDKSFRERTFVDDSNNKITFRDRWLVSITLDKEITEATVKYSYYAERALLIDDSGRNDLVEIALFNPYKTNIPYELKIDLLNFSTLDKDRIILPYGATASELSYKSNGIIKDNGVQIHIQRFFSAHSQYEFNLTLPLEISTCDAEFVNAVYYGLVGMTLTFIVFSVLTVLYLYKE